MGYDWDKFSGSRKSAGEELRERVDALKRWVSPPGGAKTKMWVLVVIAVVSIIGYASYFTIQPDETGVLLRFGQFVRLTEPGLHFKIPLGIERVYKVKTGRIFQTEFGYRTAQAGVRSRFVERGYEDESLMLSGDLNVIDMQWTVQYRINDPMNYLFKVRNPEQTLRDVSEAMMRQEVGSMISDQVLTVGRTATAEGAKVSMQKILDDYATGINIVTIKLQNVNPPEQVKAAFNEVNEARQEKESLINQAQEAYNKEIPKAKGKAKQVITEAEGYALEKINQAKGEATRFTDVLKEYRAAKRVTRKRLYLEAIVKLLGSAKEVYVVDSKQKSLLPIFEINKGRAK